MKCLHQLPVLNQDNLNFYLQMFLWLQSSRQFSAIGCFQLLDSSDIAKFGPGRNGTSHSLAPLIGTPQLGVNNISKNINSRYISTFQAIGIVIDRDMRLPEIYGNLKELSISKVPGNLSKNYQ